MLCTRRKPQTLKDRVGDAVMEDTTALPISSVLGSGHTTSVRLNSQQDIFGKQAT